MSQHFNTMDHTAHVVASDQLPDEEDIDRLFPKCPPKRTSVKKRSNRNIKDAPKKRQTRSKLSSKLLNREQATSEEIAITQNNTNPPDVGSSASKRGQNKKGAHIPSHHGQTKSVDLVSSDEGGNVTQGGNRFRRRSAYQNKIPKVPSLTRSESESFAPTKTSENILTNGPTRRPGKYAASRQLLEQLERSRNHRVCQEVERGNSGSRNQTNQIPSPIVIKSRDMISKEIDIANVERSIAIAPNTESNSLTDPSVPRYISRKTITSRMTSSNAQTIDEKMMNSGLRNNIPNDDRPTRHQRLGADGITIRNNDIPTDTINGVDASKGWSNGDQGNQDVYRIHDNEDSHDSPSRLKIIQHRVDVSELNHPDKVNLMGACSPLPNCEPVERQLDFSGVGAISSASQNIEESTNNNLLDTPNDVDELASKSAILEALSPPSKLFDSSLTTTSETPNANNAALKLSASEPVDTKFRIDSNEIHNAYFNTSNNQQGVQNIADQVAQMTLSRQPILSPNSVHTSCTVPIELDKFQERPADIHDNNNIEITEIIEEDHASAELSDKIQDSETDVNLCSQAKGLIDRTNSIGLVDDYKSILTTSTRTTSSQATGCFSDQHTFQRSTKLSNEQTDIETNPFNGGRNVDCESTSSELNKEHLLLNRDPVDDDGLELRTKDTSSEELCNSADHLVTTPLIGPDKRSKDQIENQHLAIKSKTGHVIDTSSSRLETSATPSGDLASPTGNRNLIGELPIYSKESQQPESHASPQVMQPPSPPSPSSPSHSLGSRRPVLVPPGRSQRVVPEVTANDVVTEPVMLTSNLKMGRSIGEMPIISEAQSEAEDVEETTPWSTQKLDSTSPPLPVATKDLAIDLCRSKLTSTTKVSVDETGDMTEQEITKIPDVAPVTTTASTSTTTTTTTTTTMSLRHHRLTNETSHFSVVRPTPITTSANTQPQVPRSASLQFNNLSDCEENLEDYHHHLAKSKRPIVSSPGNSRTKIDAELGCSLSCRARPDLDPSGSPTHQLQPRLPPVPIQENRDDLTPTTKTALIFPRLDEGLSSEAGSEHDDLEPEEDERGMDADDDDDDDDDDVDDDDEDEDDDDDNDDEDEDDVDDEEDDEEVDDENELEDDEDERGNRTRNRQFQSLNQRHQHISRLNQQPTPSSSSIGGEQHVVLIEQATVIGHPIDGLQYLARGAQHLNQNKQLSNLPDERPFSLLDQPGGSTGEQTYHLVSNKSNVQCGGPTYGELADHHQHQSGEHTKVATNNNSNHQNQNYPSSSAIQHNGPQAQTGSNYWNPTTSTSVTPSLLSQSQQHQSAAGSSSRNSQHKPLAANSSPLINQSGSNPPTTINSRSEETNKLAGRLSSDTDNETDRLLGNQRSDQQLKMTIDMQSNPLAPTSTGAGNHNNHSNSQMNNLNNSLVRQQQGQVVQPGHQQQHNSKEGSTHNDCEGRAEKEDRIHQAEMAVHEVKFRNGNQPATDVQLFISTEKIMVLEQKHLKIMMDHSLRTISYIADIGDAIVLIVRKKSGNSGGVTGGGESSGSGLGAPSIASKISCHVFESSESHTITKSISHAFQVAYTELLKANGSGDSSSYLPKELDYQEVLNSQEMSTDELEMFARKENQREVIVPKSKGEILGISIVESGWGSVLPTVVIANLKHDSPAYRCKKLSIGDQILSVNGISLVGLPLADCQEILRKTRQQRVARLSVVPCPITVEVKIKRPDTKYQLGFSVQNGVICSLLRGGIAERGGVRVGHRIMSINGTTVVGVPHEKIVTLLASSVGEIRMKTCLTSLYRLILGEENPVHF